MVHVVSLRHFTTDRPSADLCAVTRPLTLGKLARALAALLPGCFGEGLPLLGCSGRPHLGPSAADFTVLIVDDVGVCACAQDVAP